jgi:signal transduction histidine kinase
MDSHLRILHLEDDATDSALVREALEAGGFACEVTRVDTEAAFSTALDRGGGFDLILADNTLPSFDGLSALRLARERRPEVPFVFVAGTLDEQVAIESLKVGATDYVFKTKLSRVVPSVRRALCEAEERARRAQAEDALLRSESYLVEAQRLSQTGSFGIELSTGRIRWSEETFRIFELDAATTPTVELILQRTHPEDRPLVERVVESSSRERKAFDLEHRLLMPDGSTKHVRVVGHPLENQLEIVGAVTDVTESRRAEAARKESQEALRAKEAELARVARAMMVGEMAASIAHEVRQPVSAILLNGKACLRWLSGERPDLGEARAAVERVVADAARTGDIITRIRALTRKSTTEKEPLDVDQAIEEVLTFARGAVSRNRIEVDKQLRGDLPRVLGDRVQLQQLLLNLFMNAIEAMSEVTGRPRVLRVATTDHDRAHVAVAVRDTGVGLDPRGREHIFDAFYTTKPWGMGMGLAISRSIVREHGGELWAEANDGPGTTFRFTLPKAT